MASHRYIKRSSRALSLCGALAALVLAGAVAQAEDVAQFSDQAEWAQGYDADAKLSVQRSTTPVLSAATFDATERSIEQYRQIVQHGGWNRVPSGQTLKLGSSGASVVALRKRLIVSGDLNASSGASPVFDSYVDAGVKHFQARHGLIENGVVSAVVLSAMNIPADTRLHQLEINLVRLKAFSGNLGERYVMANIPAEAVETVENGVVATHHRAGVGRIDRQSPVMQTRALDINFNPYWHVPPSLIKKDMIPKMQANSNYLTENHIHVINKSGQEVSPASINWHSNEATNYSYREDPGTNNSLGVVRVNINNPYGVYMHDTSEKGVFGDDNRFISSGCIRVQNVREYMDVALEGHARLGTRAGRRRRSAPRQAASNAKHRAAGAGVLDLHHRVVDPGRPRAVPRRHLPARRVQQRGDGLHRTSRSAGRPDQPDKLQPACRRWLRPRRRHPRCGARRAVGAAASGDDDKGRRRSPRSFFMSGAQFYFAGPHKF